MAWDKDLPSGSKAAHLLDNDIRTNNSALETALDEEHAFASGGVQTGKHTFAVEDEATRDADTDYAAGSVSITTDTVTGEYVFTYTHDGSTWHTPIDPFLANTNNWVKGQKHTVTALTPAANIASAWTDADIFTVTLDQNSTLTNPTDLPTTGTESAVKWYIITQGAGGPFTLGYGPLFTNDGGITGSTGPTINPTALSITVLMCVLDKTGDIQVSALSGPATTTVSGIVELATDAEAATGTDTARATTPSNFNNTSMGTGTGVSGWAYKNGQSSSGNRFIEQWVSVTTSANPHTVTWPVAFATANYTTSYSTGANYAGIINKTTTTCQIQHLNGPPQSVDIIAVGEEAP